MKVIEALKFNKELLFRLKKAGIRFDDTRYIGLYDDYTSMRAQGEKVSCIVALLSERYGICERKVYSLVKRFQSDCNPYTAS